MKTLLTILAMAITMGGWRTHFCYTDIDQLVYAKGTVYGVAGGALLSVDYDNNEARTYSKLTGLNDNNIHKIFWIDNQDRLLVAYNNGNIDLINPDSYLNAVENINDLAVKMLNGDKSINGLACDGSTAYLACGFGIATLNVRKLEFGDTYTIGRNGDAEAVLNVLTDDKNIYALLADRLLYAEKGNKNLMNYQNWHETQTPAVDGFKDMCMLNGNIYLLCADSTVWMSSNGLWSQYDSGVLKIWCGGGCLFMKHADGRCSVSGKQTVHALDQNPSAATYDGSKFWYSDFSGIYCKAPGKTESQHYFFAGPGSNFAWKIKSRNDRVMVVPGGRSASNYYRDGYVSWFDENYWKYISGGVHYAEFPSHWAYDFVNVEVDPKDKTHFWVAGYGVGLVEFRDDKFYKVWTFENSNIETLYPEGRDIEKYNYMRIDGLAYDSKGRLWFTNPGESPVKYLDADYTWHNTNYSELTGLETLEEILIDQKVDGRKWLLCPRYKSSGDSYLFVFDDNGNHTGFTSAFDQDAKQITFNEHLLRSIAQDKSGNIWIGTSEGCFYISSNVKLFDGSVLRCTRVKIARNDGSNLADYLLGTEQINCIAIDGGNRKWFGTENGVFLVSADGLETIHHFTAENSPLLSNSVKTIGINGQTGEVFFGTALGMIGFQSDAAESHEDLSDIHAYPNPVRPEFSGEVTITGLMENTHVKICDVSGATVYETISNGGIATWNPEGVPSGVYFALCFTESGVKGRCKILKI